MRFVGATSADAVASILARAAALQGSEGGPAMDELPAFQAAAARRACAAMAHCGGAIVADAVGTGKTHVALAVLSDHLRATRTDAALVVPASLRAHWGPRLRSMARDAGACVWRIPGPHPGGDGPRVLWLSHAHLSRHGALAVAPPLVVVDEAHAFRNPATRRYRALAATCVGSRVLLLTATPINNSVLDLHAQIRLFAADGAFAELGIASLDAAFRAAAAGDWPTGLDDVIAAVLVRRDRHVIERSAAIGGNAGPALVFPRRLPPRVVEYRAEPARTRRLLHGIEALELGTLGLGAGPGRLATGELVRLLLLKRLESSPAAFRATVERLLAYHRAFLDELNGGGLLLPRDHRAFASAGQLSFAGLLSRALPRGFDAEAAASRAECAVAGLLALLEASSADDDPKADALGALIRTDLAGHRVLVFTEYRETATHLWRMLRDRHRVAMVHGGGAWLGADRCPRDAAAAQFAPGARVHPMSRADILIATDVLAEGLDLQAADRVVSWDLPWNPVRLIQRVGRIDRLGSPHACIAAYLFLPDRGLDAMLGLMRRLRAKLAAIRRGVGHEPALLGDEDPEQIATLVRRARAGDRRLLADLDRDPMSNSLGPLLEDAPADPFPPGETPVGLCPAAGAILVVVVIGGMVRWLVDPPTPNAHEMAAAMLRAAQDSCPPVPAPAAVRHLADRAQRIVAARSEHTGAADPVRARVSRHLLAALAATPGGPPAPLLARAERLLHSLARGGNAAVDAHLRRLLRDPPDGADAFCAAVDALVAPASAPRAATKARILGILAPQDAAVRT